MANGKISQASKDAFVQTVFALASLQGVCNRATLVIQVLEQHIAGMAAFSFNRFILRQN